MYATKTASGAIFDMLHHMFVFFIGVNNRSSMVMPS